MRSSLVSTLALILLGRVRDSSATVSNGVCQGDYELMDAIAQNCSTVEGNVFHSSGEQTTLVFAGLLQKITGTLIVRPPPAHPPSLMTRTP